nr:hypothetical protein [uncultured Desulfobacter sp.]
MKKILLIIIVLFGIVFLLTGGRSVVESRVARWTTNFNTLSSDDRILYEDGAEKLATLSALHLDKAIRDVASKQLGEFTEPVKVYIFATPKSFSKFSGITDQARGASIGNEIFLSSLLTNLPDEVYGMLGHELSHVQLAQKLGVITFNRTLPRWFREGLAIYVSDGGGAPRNYEKETIAMFIDGKHFVPEEKGSIFNMILHSTAEIGPRMYYSQSGMFVKYLASTFPQKFDVFLNCLQEGKPFKKSFEESFSENIENTLALYITNLKNA